MAKKSSVEKNNRRKRLVVQYAEKRGSLLEVIKNKNTSKEDRFKAVLKLAELPRNSSKVRVRNRCENSGRARGYYRKFRLSRIEFRNLASLGLVPGVKKASW